ncbi:MAG TPA: ABC transporter permease [Gemmatimonadaceae bacterium]|jgi:predicted permease
MLTPRQLLRRVRDLLHGGRLESDVDDELRFHIEMQTAALIGQGMPPGRARAKAESDFGAVSRVTDGVREARGLSAAHIGDDLGRDVRFALRSLLRSPAFTIVAVVTLMLGIGATTAMFSVVNAVLLSALPYPNADRLVELHERAVTENRSYSTAVSAPNFTDWHAQSKTIELMSAYRGGETTVLGLRDPIKANLYAVSQDYFRLFGGAPALGRTFNPDETLGNAATVAVVSYAFWRDQLGARNDLASAHLQAWGQTVTVVGVMPKGFGYPDDAEVWIPLEPLNREMGRDSHNDDTIGRLATGVSRDVAEREMTAIAQRLRQVYPTHNVAVGAEVVGLRDSIVGPVRKYLNILFGAVAVVLLVACVNLASANLARAAGRARELAIRTVLGAGRGRLARQLLTESVLVASAGGAAGLLMAQLLVRGMLAYEGNVLPRAGGIAISAPVLVFALGVTIGTGLLIGVLPALQVGQSDLRAGVTAGGRGTAVGRSSMRRGLVIAEVAFAVLLLIGAGLLVRSFRALLSENAGFTSDGVLAVNVALPETRYRSGGDRSRFYDQAIDALRAIPGVESVGLINIAPLSRAGFGGGVGIEGRPTEENIYSDYRIVSSDYFKTMHIPLLAGRVITGGDDSTSQHVTVINQAMAKKFFPGENPLGKRLIELGMDSHRAMPMTVVGVVGDVRSDDLSKGPRSQHFVPYRQRPERASFGVLTMRTKLSPASMGPTARASIRSLDPNVLATVQTMDDIRDKSVGSRRFTMVVLSAFAALGLVLAAIGIYGVLSYSVARRTREIGVRMALGAVRSSVVAMVLRDSLTPVAIGSVLGIVAAFVGARLIAALLYGVSATDPLTFAGVVVVLLGVAIVASIVPASRAARVDPIVALREE